MTIGHRAALDLRRLLAASGVSRVLASRPTTGVARCELTIDFESSDAFLVCGQTAVVARRNPDESRQSRVVAFRCRRIVISSFARRWNERRLSVKKGFMLARLLDLEPWSATGRTLPDCHAGRPELAATSISFALNALSTMRQTCGSPVVVRRRGVGRVKPHARQLAFQLRQSLQLIPYRRGEIALLLAVDGEHAPRLLVAGVGCSRCGGVGRLV